MLGVGRIAEDLNDKALQDSCGGLSDSSNASRYKCPPSTKLGSVLDGLWGLMRGLTCNSISICSLAASIHTILGTTPNSCSIPR